MKLQRGCEGLLFIEREEQVPEGRGNSLSGTGAEVKQVIANEIRG